MMHPWPSFYSKLYSFSRKRTVTIAYKNTTKTLLIVDNDEILQCLLHKYLTTHHFSTQFLASGNGLPALLAKNRIDLVVMDVLLPDKSGIYWLKWLRQYHAAIPVIIASIKANEDDRLLGLENGAKDYLIKPFQCKELLIRIDNILAAHSHTDNDNRYLQIGELTLDTETGIVAKGSDHVKLTQLETDILKLLYINAGSIISRDDIMGQIRGTIHNPLDRSIDIHINKLRNKIENNPAEPTYIRTVRGKGYRLHVAEWLSADDAIKRGNLQHAVSALIN
jgi:DNA-binding response OmpR family regulator